MNAQEPEAGRQSSTPLSLEEVIRMAKANLSEELVVARIKRNNRPFDLNGDEILELRKSGVSETVLKYLLDPNLPYTAPVPPPPVAEKPKPAAPAKPLDPVAAKVPEEPGLYLLSPVDRFTKVELKSIMPLRRGGKLAEVVTGGLKKGATVGSIAGGSASVRIRGSAPVLFFRAIDKVNADDFVLLKLDKHKDRRELTFGVRPEKPVFPPKSVVQFETRHVASGLTRISTGALQSGEYLFFILGSGDERRSLLGKGFDFGVD